MKTKLLITSLLLLAFGLLAQNVSTNGSDKLLRALRKQYTNTTGDAAAAPVTAAPTDSAGVQSAPSAPSMPSQTFPAFPAPQIPSPRVRTVVPVHAAAQNDASDMDKPFEGTIDFAGADLNSVLLIYAKLVNRTLLRAANLPSPPITLHTQTALTKREAIQALDVILGLNGIGVINEGEKFAKVVPVSQVNQEGAPFSYVDAADLPDMGQYVTHVVQLQFAKPSEVVQVLAPFQKMPNAAIAIDSSGIIVLRDYTENVKRMLEMIAKVDVSVPAEIESEVIPIKYALAGDIASALNSVSSGSQTTTVGSGAGGGSGSSPGGGRSTGLNGARQTTTYGGVGTSQGTSSRFGGAGNANPNMGGTSGGLNTGTLGSGGAAGSGGTFGDRIRAIVQRASGGGGGSGDFQIMGQTKIIADERTNSLLVFATHDDMLMIKSIVAKLDVVLAQVLIEAIIVDVTLGNARSVGVSAAQQPAQMGPLAGGGGFANGPAFMNIVGSGTNLATKAASLSGFTTNIFSSLGSGFSYFGTLNQGWDFTLTALETDNRVNILSRPRIQTSHAVPATLFIGQTIPYIDGTTTDINGGNRSTYEQRDVGINLSVLPLINPEGLVVMDIQEDIEQLGQNVIIDGNPIPQTIRRSASAKVAVRDGDTIILGGFISTTKSKSKSGVPFLSSIPLLGYLFRQTSDSTERDELAVLLHPKVLPTPEVAAIASDEDQRQMPGVMRAKDEIGKAERKAMDDEQKRELREDSQVKP